MDGAVSSSSRIGCVPNPFPQTGFIWVTVEMGGGAVAYIFEVYCRQVSPLLSVVMYDGGESQRHVELCQGSGKGT